MRAMGAIRSLAGPGSLLSRNGSTLRSATSCCAVTVILGDCSTRGVQPRCNCAARRPDNTTNSNAFMPCGRFTIMSLFVASANEERVDKSGDENHRWHDEYNSAANRPIVSGASRQPGRPAGIGVRITFRLEWHHALTSVKVWGGDKVRMAED